MFYELKYKYYLYFFKSLKDETPLVFSILAGCVVSWKAVSSRDCTSLRFIDDSGKYEFGSKNV